MASITFYGQQVTVTDLSCATIKPIATSVLNWNGFAATACSSDPVAAGTLIIFGNQASSSAWSSYITAVLNDSSSSNTDQFDYAYAAQLWVGAFSITIGLYLLAFKIGTILRFFRSA